jgi:hypothetical protein
MVSILELSSLERAIRAGLHLVKLARPGQRTAQRQIHWQHVTLRMPSDDTLVRATIFQPVKSRPLKSDTQGSATGFGSAAPRHKVELSDTKASV